MSGEKLTLEFDELVVTSQEEEVCPYIVVKYGEKTFTTAIQDGKRCSFGETFDLGSTENKFVDVQIWDYKSEAMLGERCICTDQLKVGTGIDDKYKVLIGCVEVAEIRIISKFTAASLGDRIGEYLRDKVENYSVIYACPPEILEPQIQVAPQPAMQYPQQG